MRDYTNQFCHILIMGIKYYACIYVHVGKGFTELQNTFKKGAVLIKQLIIKKKMQLKITCKA